MNWKSLLQCAAAVLALIASAAGCGEAEKVVAKMEISGPESFSVWMPVQPGIASVSASVRATGGEGYRFDARKELKLEMDPGEYIFKFSAPGHRDSWRTYKLARGTNRLKLKLEPISGVLLIASNPAGAAVTLDGKEAGVTPLVADQLVPGAHEIGMSRKGFSPQFCKVEIDSERPRVVSVDLVASIGRMEIVTKPRGARVFIDDQEVGTTPYRLEREAGRYQLRPELPGYIPVEENISVERQSNTRSEFTLAARPGSVTIESEPAGAQVLVEGVKKGVTPCKPENLAPGNYRVSVSLEGYDNAEANVAVAPGVDDTFKFALVSSTGILCFIPRPAGVRVLVDGKEVGISESDLGAKGLTREMRVTGLQPGRHRIQLNHPLAPKALNVNVDVPKGEIKRLAEPLTLWLADCEIVHRDGERERGALYGELDTHILFSPMPGIVVKISRKELKEINKIPVEPVK